jgi:SAM-dependent methyltransferase
MRYGTHLTTKAQRDILLSKKWSATEINVDDVLTHPNMVWDEEFNFFYQQDFQLLETRLKNIDRGTFDPRNIPESWEKKGNEILVRMKNLPDLYRDIKKNGVREPILVERTGERIDGSFRCMISKHLGIEKIPARIAAFTRRDIDQAFINRKIHVNRIINGIDYYRFQYPDGTYNVDTKNPVYTENAADRWEVLKDYIAEGHRILDVGCNEGYMSIMAATKGNSVVGFDIEHTQAAWLNKLAFEYQLGQDLDISFNPEKIEYKKFDLVLALNVLYHLDNSLRNKIMQETSGKMIIQCNHRKSAERKKYYASHVDDARALAEKTGWKVEKQIDWRDKPILIITKP